MLSSFLRPEIIWKTVLNTLPAITHYYSSYSKIIIVLAFFFMLINYFFKKNRSNQYFKVSFRKVLFSHKSLAQIWHKWGWMRRSSIVRFSGRDGIQNQSSIITSKELNFINNVEEE